MSCSNQLYITLFIVLIFILIFINFKVCKYNKLHKIDKIEGFRNNNTFGKTDKDTSKYLFACVDTNGNLNQYYVPGDGSMWSNAVKFAESGGDRPSGLMEVGRSVTWSNSDTSNPVSGIKYEDNNNTIFKWMSENGYAGSTETNWIGTRKSNNFNSYGGGTNSTEAVINLTPSDITAPNFENNNCTKESWYLYRDVTGNDYIYAVFKRKPWTDNLICCNNNNIQRNSCNDKYTNINGNDCNNYMKEYCGNGANVTLDVCKNWCAVSTNSATCKNYQISFCNSTNFKDNKEFCKSKCKTKECDLGVADYCNYIVTNNLPNDNYCACFGINAKASTSTAVIAALQDLKLSESDPICYSSQCRSSASYITQGMENATKGCPICLQTMTLTNLTKAEDIKQSCNVNINNTTTSTSALPTQTLPTPAPQTQYQPQPQLPIQKPMPEMTLSDYLDQFTKLLNDILDSIANLF